jgi:two-component system, sensor histidine kinase
MQDDSLKPEVNSNTLDALHRFEARSDANGLLLRYASGRVRGLPGRQVLTVLGSVALGVFENRTLGLATLALGFLGDAVDCAFLSHMFRRFRNAVVPAGWRLATILFALVQSATIAACVALAWTSSDRIGIVFVSTAFLFGGIINAGLSRPYLPPAADIRLAVFALTWLLLTSVDLAVATNPAVWFAENAYLLIAGAMMAYSAVGYIGFIGRNFTRKLKFEHQLLRQQHALEQSSAELALREAQARRLALVAENANDIVIIYTPDGKIDWVNPTFTRTLGFTLDEVKGKFPGEVLNPECLDADKVEEIVQARKAARSFRAELRNRTRDGHTIWIETSSVPILNPDGSLAMTVQVERDVTAARAHAAELAEARVRAEAAADAKTRFLATMSHEIRTPLNGVVAMADVLAASALSPDQAECVTAIRDSGQTLLALVSDVLDLSQIQSGALRLAAEPFDAVALTEAVARLAQPVAQAKGLSLTCDPHDPIWLSGDAGRLRQILLNIVGNAVKFTATGSIAVKLSRGAEANGRIPLSVIVRDTGIGIPPDRHEAIFDTFTQGDISIHGQFGGTGLGLSISRHLAQAMGGGITVQSEPDKGATFTVSLALPASAPSSLPAAPPAADFERSLMKLSGRRVLVAEDNRTNRLILRRLLEPLSLHLTEAENGAEAVEAYGNAPPDLILMDIQMPVMDGLAAIRAIREQEHARGWPRCPILVVTANAFAEDRAACESAGSDDFLPKPVRREALYDRIGRFLIQAA